MDFALKKEEKDVLNVYVLDVLKKLSSNMSVECVYALTMVHNYHNTYGKPVVKLVAIVNRCDGNLEDIIDEINSKHELLFDIKVEKVNYKEYSNNRYRMIELKASNVLYDKYGVYHIMKSMASDLEPKEKCDPRLIKIETSYKTM